MTDDSLMRGFLLMKALIARYGVNGAADIRTLADRLVQQGEFTSWSQAIRGIEENMGVSVTTPLSKEAADYTTHRGAS